MLLLLPLPLLLPPVLRTAHAQQPHHGSWRARVKPARGKDRERARSATTRERVCVAGVASRICAQSLVVEDQ
eukprot:6424043-Prymnesium_polylepis.1